jgi:hypothetical protein
VFGAKTRKSATRVPEPRPRPGADGIVFYYTPGTMTLTNAHTLVFTIDASRVHATVKTATFHPTSDQPPGCDGTRRASMGASDRHGRGPAAL